MFISVCWSKSVWSKSRENQLVERWIFKSPPNSKRSDSFLQPITRRLFALLICINLQTFDSSHHFNLVFSQGCRVYLARLLTKNVHSQLFSIEMIIPCVNWWRLPKPKVPSAESADDKTSRNLDELKESLIVLIMCWENQQRETWSGIPHKYE